MNRWLRLDGAARGDDYDRRWRELAASGVSIHGEADLVCALVGDGPARVLDAGCGTGRVAIELALRGHHVVGIDMDEAMLATARAKAPHLRWECADLATLGDVESGPAFDLALMAGNVMIFVEPGSESVVLAAVAAKVRPDGLVVSGFSLTPGGLTVEDYDAYAADQGLVLADRWSTWDREPFTGGDYAVSVHRRRP